MIPLDVSTLPFEVLRTTAGLTAAATSIVADDSSMVTGWLFAPTVVPVAAVGVATGRSRTPVALSASTVPPEARTADSSAALKTVPIPPRRRVAGWTLALVTGAAATEAAGSYQRSG